jgi:hypothetical protein
MEKKEGNRTGRRPSVKKQFLEVSQKLLEHQASSCLFPASPLLLAVEILPIATPITSHLKEIAGVGGLTARILEGKKYDDRIITNMLGIDYL